ncbi:DNA helicase RecQ [Nitratifractor sp.]
MKSEKKRELLRHYFGHEEFRSFQEEAIDALLEGRDLLMILPTGGGKSLCYQLPSLMMEGVTIVVSPLLALMHDQVTALEANGISAAMLSSLQSMEESREIVGRLRRGEIRLLYVAPERLNNDFFSQLLGTLKVNFFVIDEAHCVSEWGHEFREDYRKLSQLRERYPQIPIAAFTATATEEVERDILSHLALWDPVRIRGSLYRKNLTVRARYRIGDGRGQLLDLLERHRGESGIVYTLSRKQTESLAEYLNERGYKAAAFHAGLSSEERRRVYGDFIADRIETVVATVAFGMGIDKSNIRYVTHMTLPKSVENYYQEIGRAGRDGLASETLLLFGAQDLAMQRQFLEQLPEGDYKRYAYGKLETLWRLVSGEECRHRALAAYFGEEIGACGERCDNCLTPPARQREITEEARKFLSAVYRSGQRFGIGYLVDLLRGSANRRIASFGHDRLSVYGIGKELDKAGWSAVADRLLEMGAIALDEHRGVRLSPAGVEILKGSREVSIRQDRMERWPRRAKRKAISPEELSYDERIFEELRALRSRIAEENGVPPYVIFSDRTLKELSEALPGDKAGMLEIHGIGEVKFDRYGEIFLEKIRELDESR